MIVVDETTQKKQGEKMITLESLPKTETYLGRKEYNEKFPNEKDHINMTKLIDSLIKVAVHMKDKLKLESNLNFDWYVQTHGVNYFYTPILWRRADRNNSLHAKGILQSEGVWKGRKLYPFFQWTDSNQESYELRQGKVLKAIFEILAEGKVDDSNIVSTVEEVDMWFNS
tara:strand:+ start:52 stop:561 length:510 start_codon:yes stop_codon:yes gene_type:complete